MLAEIHYLPCIEYFAHITRDNEWVIEGFEHYQKQTYRNRCKILTANGIDTLLIPILYDRSHKMIQDIRIDYSQRWAVQHWRALQMAYAKAPYFDFFSDFFEKIYQEKPVFLFDLNMKFMTICLKLLKLTPTIRQTDAYELPTKISQYDGRELIHPKKTTNFVGKPYKQNFGSDFVPNLSIIDLLMCQGPQAHTNLIASINQI
jgi:WbqC-like protein family